MCGIIGYFGSETIKVHELFDALAELEDTQLEREKTPVGGHGAGIIIFDAKREVIKVGKTNGSPVQILRDKVKDIETMMVLAHVRRASKKFSGTIGSAECTQPYRVRCAGSFEIFSAHNGYLRTYKNIKKIVGKDHVFESEKVKLIDSEIVPHYFEKLYIERKNFADAAYDLYYSLSGKGNAVALALRSENDLQLALLYKGRARGLYVWENDIGDIFFSSRQEVIDKNFATLTWKNRFKLVKAIAQGIEGDCKIVKHLRKSDHVI